MCMHAATLVKVGLLPPWPTHDQQLPPTCTCADVVGAKDPIMGPSNVTPAFYDLQGVGWAGPGQTRPEVGPNATARPACMK